MEDSLSYEVRERSIQVVHVGETIHVLSLEISWTESFWHQGWKERHTINALANVSVAIVLALQWLLKLSLQPCKS